MFQKEDSHPYTNSVVSQTEEIWNFPVQRSNGCLDSSHHQLPGSASSSYNLNGSHDILSQLFSGTSKASHDCFSGHPTSTDAAYAPDGTAYQLGNVDETFGFEELQESSKSTSDNHNFESIYAVNPDFLHDDFNVGPQNFASVEETVQKAIKIRDPISENQGKAFISGLDFLNGEVSINNSELFNDQSFLEVPGGIQETSFLEFPKQYSNGTQLSDSHDLENDLGAEFFSKSDDVHYSEVPEWKSSHETDKTLVESEYCGYNSKTTKKKSGVSIFLECGSGLSDDRDDSRPSTPELSHSSGDSVTPKMSQLNRQFLSMREIEISNNQSADIIQNQPTLSHPSFLTSINSESTVKLASLKQSIPTETSLNYTRGFRANTGNLKTDVYVSSPSSPSKRKKQRIDPKSIPIRFKVSPKSFIKLQKSVVKCLDVTLDYHGYTGIITEVILNNSITNYYRNYDIDFLVKPRQLKRPLYIKYHLARDERIENGYEYGTHEIGNPEIHCHMGVVQRKIYIRDISAIMNDVSHIKYHKSPNFNINNPYEPQYTRFETDESGVENNETKCGLCAYCKEVRFLPFKNSSYLSHMTLGHGVFADNFIVPEGINFGKYVVPRDKENEPDKTKEIEGLQCPACLEIIEMSCWKTKENPLLKYFRHYKKEHVKEDKRRSNVNSKVNPLEFKTNQEA